MGTYIKIQLKDTTKRNIDTQNSNLKAILSNELRDMPEVDLRDLVIEYFKDSPSVLIEDYDSKHDREKVFIHFSHMIQFFSKADQRINYEYWKTNRSAFAFVDELTDENLVLTFKEFEKIHCKKNSYFIKNYGELMVDVAFGRCPDLFLKVLGEFMNYEVYTLEFSNLEQLDKLFPYMEHEISLEYLEMKIFDKDYFKTNKGEVVKYDIGQVTFIKSYDNVKKSSI